MDPRVEHLINLPKVEQRSKEWFDLRSNMITASSAANLLNRNSKTCDPYIKTFKLEDIFDKDGKCCNPYSSRNQYILEKCRGSKFKGSVATLWGQQYEDVVCDLYRNKYNTDVLDFGIIQHPEHKWLGASPDGITPGGVMLEIKCPFRRKITGVTPLYYWIQVMLQLEVCGLDDCDFAEYEFMEFSSEEEFLDDETLDKTVHHKGLMIKIETLTEETPDPFENGYVYPPRNLLDKTDDLLDWVKVKMRETMESFSRDEQVTKVVSPIYWKVVDYSIVRLKRDKEWFENVRPDFEKAWNEILFYRKGNNYRHLVTKDTEDNSIDELSGKVLHLDISSNACLLSESEDEECALEDD